MCVLLMQGFARIALSRPGHGVSYLPPEVPSYPPVAPIVHRYQAPSWDATHKGTAHGTCCVCLMQKNAWKRSVLAEGRGVSRDSGLKQSLAEASIATKRKEEAGPLDGYNHITTSRPRGGGLNFRRGGVSFSTAPPPPALRAPPGKAVRAGPNRCHGAAIPETASLCNHFTQSRQTGPHNKLVDRNKRAFRARFALCLPLSCRSSPPSFPTCTISRRC